MLALVSAGRVLCIALAFSPMAAAAQTTGAATPGAASVSQGIGLTPDNKRLIYRETAQLDTRPTPSGIQVAIGAEIPDSVMLTEMPVVAKDRVGALRDFKFSRLPDETLVIVDPSKRRIVDIITRDEGLASQ